MTAHGIQYEGYAYNEKLHKGKRSGTISISAMGIQFKSEKDSVMVPIKGANLSIGGASDRLVFISHPSYPEWNIVTSDRSLLNNPLLQQDKFVQSQLTKAKRKRIFNWSLAGVVAVLVVAIPILLLVNMDILSGVIARQIPAAWEAELGESTLPGLRDENALMDKDRSDRLLSPLVNPLVSTVSNNRYDFDFNIINNAELNAFALPGGYVVIHSGLILTADSAEELLGVLAHEISHVTEQHGIKNIIGSAGIYLILSALLGDLTGILGTITSASYLLLNQSYSRRFESDADQKGHDLLVAAGINPRGLGSFFEKLIEEEQKLLEMIESDETRSLVERSLGFLSSHPATGDRIENLRDMWENESGDYLDLDEPFRILKTEVEQFVLKTNKESTGDENSD